MLWYRLQLYMCVYSMCLCVSTVCRKHTSTGIYESFRLWHSDPYHKVRNTSAAAAVVVSRWPWFKKSLKLLLLNFTIIMIWNGKRLIGTNLRGSRCCYCSALAQIQTPILSLFTFPWDPPFKHVFCHFHCVLQQLNCHVWSIFHWVSLSFNYC